MEQEERNEEKTNLICNTQREEILRDREGVWLYQVQRLKY
jgi:hypothetical protein